MTSKIIIITSVTLYTIIFAALCISYSNKQFTGSDIAGNGMAKGLTFIYGLGILLLIAIVVTIINAFFYKGITDTWIKFLFFVPISLPLSILTFTFLEIGRPRQPSIEEQSHKLTFEIRTKEKLDDLSFSLRTSNSGSHSSLNNRKEETNFYVYTFGNAIFYERSRMFSMRWGEYKTPEYDLEIPYKPQIIPFTNWESLNGINEDTKDTVKLEFRYKISKSVN